MTSTTHPRPGATSATATFSGRFLGWLGVGARRPLPRLADTHPAATGAPRRWRGVGTIPVSAIVGTGSAARGTRRSDFRPSDGHAAAGWQLRWERLNDAAWNQIALPPIVALKAADGYWVLDGHNRVALAKATRQEWIDAEVTELFLPSAQASTTAHFLTTKEA
jgi:hypothetical protein